MTHRSAGSGAEAAPPRLEAGGMPLHRQLFLVLKDQISRGALAPGQALPPEPALCEQFGVSRITVRRALQDLSDQGYVRRRPGRGTYVREWPLAAPPPPALTVLDGMRKAQLETNVEVIEFGLRTPPPLIAAGLALPGGAESLYVLRLRRDRADNQPLMITETWLPPAYADFVDRETLTERALFEILAASGLTIGRVVQELTAEIAGPLQARLLHVSIGAPLIRVNRIVYDASLRPAEYLSLFLSPDRSRIVMDIPAEDLDAAGSGFIAHDIPRDART